MNHKATIVSDSSGKKHLVIFGKDSAIKTKDLVDRLNNNLVESSEVSMRCLDVTSITTIEGEVDRANDSMIVTNRGELSVVMDDGSTIYVGRLNGDDIELSHASTKEEVEQLANEFYRSAFTDECTGPYVRYVLLPYMSDDRVVTKVSDHPLQMAILDHFYAAQVRELINHASLAGILSMNIAAETIGVKIVMHMNDKWFQVEGENAITIRGSELSYSRDHVADVGVEITSGLPVFRGVEVDRTIADQIRQAFPR